MRRLLAAGGLADTPLLGTFLKIPSTQPTEILGQAGFDFVVIDEEHAPFNPETTDAILLACRSSGVAGVVRVRSPDDILRVLDCGADAVMVPHVSDGETACKAVALARYSVARGFSPTTRAGRFGAAGLADHTTDQDAHVAVIAMIEDAEALDNLDLILATEGLDAIFIGRADLEVSMGIAQRSEDIHEAVAAVLAAARAAGMPAAIVPTGAEEIPAMSAQGVGLFITGSDQGFLRASALNARTSLLPCEPFRPTSRRTTA